MYTSKILKFDNITNFRIINAIAVLFGLNLLLPVIAELRGHLLTSTVISIIMISSTASIKLNTYFVKFSISNVYKLGNTFHLVLTISTFLYFFNPLLYIYINAFLGIFEIAIFSSYAIQLDEYMAKTSPEIVAPFKVFYNSKRADAILGGLFMTTILTYLFGNISVFIIFIVYNTLFSAWLFYNWRFFDKNLSSF